MKLMNLLLLVLPLFALAQIDEEIDFRRRLATGKGSGSAKEGKGSPKLPKLPKVGGRYCATALDGSNQFENLTHCVEALSCPRSASQGR
jgi:hypothetical protein